MPRDVDRLKVEIEELFADLWQVPRFSSLRRGFRPAVDCYRTTDPPRLTVVVELPGVDPDTIEVVAADRALVISGERPRPRVEGGSYQQMEIEYGPFARRVPLTEDVDVAGATASYDRGLLTIELPLAQPPRRNVPIQVEVRRSP